MSSEEISWTENAEIEAFQAGNVMMDMTGYVDSMEGIRAVKTYQKWVFKVILANNKGKKVRVVFWSQNALEFSAKLRLYQILEITGCTVSNVKFQYDRELQGVIAPQELHLQPFSKVNVLGTFDVTTSKAPEPTIQYELVSIENSLEHGKKPIAVSGYVRNEFEVFKTVGPAETPVANGNIGDGHFRLCVQVHDFRKTLLNSPLEKGVCASFQGVIETSKAGSDFLKVNGMNNIIVYNEKPKMSAEKLRTSIYPPPAPRLDAGRKRPGENDKENDDGNDKNGDSTEDKKMKMD